ncbi:SPOR domain-containing protein [Novosphingobium sp.]|uniref:SPOR domain-containing protein n=1 Tax=Novosphingobium sp. TaxID=1874826 RepID=UPI0035B31040
MTGIEGDRDGQGGGYEDGHQGSEAWGDHDDDMLETRQLDLAEPEERLPWLESSDDDYEDDEGSETGRLLGFMVMGLVVLAAIVGGIWWATHRGPDPALVADGSTIKAPDQPYKEAPKDPGGKTFDGTGDSSFAVSEGQNRPAKLGDQPAPVTPPAPPAQTAAAAPGAKPAAAAPASGGVGVQVGAFSSQSAAETAWNKLVTQSNGALAGVSHRVIAGSADIGTVYRLQAVAPDAAAANTLCGKLKGAGISCQVK